ncbi:MAG: DGQHR domain-containing protein [Desulfobacteraceae bacterium]|nr:DGQHR domain-containing protein [Desulfobacteraceae bacterium]
MGEKREYVGFRLKQRKEPDSVNFFVFAACPGDIIRWSCVNRQEDRLRGRERRLSPARQRAITKFFTDDDVNTIPTCVVLAFKPESASFASFPGESFGKTGIGTEYLPSGSFEWGILSFEFDPHQPETERPSFVVDGQHRLFGMSEVEHDEIPVLVSALIDAEPNEQAFQFIVINNKVRRVPSDVVHSLIADFNE